jgi:pilus assembly protein FimV
LLQNAINDEPHRADLRLKLMEVYAELGDREGFVRQDSELREIGGSAAEVDQLKVRYPAMAGFAGAAIAATEAAGVDDDLGDFSLDDLTLDEPEQPAPASGLDDEFDLSLDDLESELDRDLQSAAMGDSLLGQDSLSLDSELESEAPAASVASQDDDLGFDLSLDEAGEEGMELGGDLADFSLELESESKAPEAEEDEFLLSLDEDEPSATPVADEFADLGLDLPGDTADSELDLPADFDLSMDDEEAPSPSTDFSAQLEGVSAELDQLSDSLDQPAAADELDLPAAESSPALAGLDGDDDFDFLSGTDETATKLDLARAYIDMGDTEGARDILDEVIAEGNDGQQQEARELIAKLV